MPLILKPTSMLQNISLLRFSVVSVPSQYTVRREADYSLDATIFAVSIFLLSYPGTSPPKGEFWPFDLVFLFAIRHAGLRLAMHIYFEWAGRAHSRYMDLA